MNMKKILLISVLIWVFAAICVNRAGRERHTTREQKEAAVCRYMKKYDVEIENIEIEMIDQGYLQKIKDNQYKGYVKVGGIDDYIITVNQLECDNYQPIKYIPNVEEKIYELAEPEFSEDFELMIYTAEYDEKKVPSMNFEDYCAYNWEKQELNPNRWRVAIYVVSLSDKEAIQYSQNLRDKMAEEGIYCTYSLNRYNGTKEALQEDIRRKYPIKGLPYILQDSKVITFGRGKDDFYLEGKQWKYDLYQENQ